MESIVVIGGGAAGMLAAGTAAAQGKQVVLLEKNEKLGKKLYITGKGRCNITNTGDIEDLLQNITKNRNFLYSAFYSFTNDDILHLLHQYGVPTKVERGNRVFPRSDKSSDVIKALMTYMVSHGVDIRLQSEVRDVLYEDNAVRGVRLTNNQILPCSKLIIATGGLSYPVTGSTGDGYTFAQKAGHHIVSLKPALVPLETEEKWIKNLQGLSLKNVSLQVFYQDREIHREFGEMIFTHFGISGPIVLSTSNYLAKYLDKEKIKAFINLKPALDEDTLDKRIQRDFDKYSRKQLKNALDDLLPAKLIPVIIQLSGIPEEKFVNQISKEERRILLKLITGLPLTITRTRPIQEAIITSGGIDVKEINPSTLESKKISGLHFAGEVLDVEGLTGGYNLQIAFSTGYLAGISV
ncbi:NAD(P)/FAD-dependent oxidoreductase [Geosporobacter ferrireducens]|uniref:FAD-dependent oxidoreductase n=1 Tax=Geosporobacter ferrireducens TaxID=1424294 RepID=A0A1D8GQX5_9FIRM|nr:NAD(P)/FAD-dependent oxidoreductase [Geosporobacter ferrireducens]AOT68106.1 FAD-dependent oxidoreductase [Geosporobacter ferrireducens]AOT73345.1 FAD-dependent oxidoreductase [Geosporobacter ferrireducens]MTI55341.1 NAD(P)/FAD-dependent oxidoreductase [Geosporobacter ferrireducens]